MRPLLTPEEMGRADRATIEAGTSAEVLMERAGRAVARAVVRAVGRYGRRVAVVCGKGNNGGDGFVVARVLAEEGLHVRCLAVDDPDATTGAAAHHLAAARSAGIAVRTFRSEELRGCDAIVDAILGTGSEGEPRGAARQALDAIHHITQGEELFDDPEGPGLIAGPAAEPRPIVIAVDIPSGVDGTTGWARGSHVIADITVALGAQKLGTALTPVSGLVEVADIGIAIDDWGALETEHGDVAAFLPSRSPDAHKRSNGAIALIGGSTAMPGAAILAARAAMRMGCGYATLGTVGSVRSVAEGLLPEVLTQDISPDDVLGPEALDRFADVLEGADALAIGPGLGRGEKQASLVERALREVPVPMVLDADGLNVLEDRVGALADRDGTVVITPHPAELARLLGRTTEEVQRDRVAAARDAAGAFGCIVVLKGHRTLIARPDGWVESTASGRRRVVNPGRTWVVVNPTGGPELATAGTGDVLTGAIAALLPFDPDWGFAAAWAGAYVHGVAGGLAADRFGPAGVVAWDVAENLGSASEDVSNAPPTL